MNCELVKSAFFCLLTLSSVYLLLVLFSLEKIIDQVPKDIRDSGKLHMTWLALVVEILTPSFFYKSCRQEKTRETKKSSKRKKENPPYQLKANLNIRITLYIRYNLTLWSPSFMANLRLILIGLPLGFCWACLLSVAHFLVSGTVVRDSCH